MKKLLYVVLALLTGCLTACKEELKELDKGSTPLEITLESADVLVLDEAQYASDGLVLNWTTGTNAGTGNRIYYRLELALQTDEYEENGYLAFNGETQRYQYKLTVEETNNLIGEMVDISSLTTAVDMKAQITAYGEDFDEQTAEVLFSVMPYKPVSATLYLYGDATPGGWDMAQAALMTRTTHGQFSWQGNLTTGEYKFLVTNTALLPSYNKAGENGMVLRTEEAQPDDKWTISESGYYVVRADLLDMTMSVVKSEGAKPAHEHLYFIGNESDWNFWEMTNDPVDPFLFRYGHFFVKGGEFKFGTAAGAWENNYKATSANAPYTQTTMVFVPGFDPDDKWVLKDDEINKAYKICVDIREGQERMLMMPFEPFEAVYLVGSAAPGGWDLDNATPMAPEADNEFVFTWTGELCVGELKFSTDKQTDWNGGWFMAAENAVVPSGQEEQMVFVNKSQDWSVAQYVDINAKDLDNKWNISEAGTYTITLNSLSETITIVKQ